MTTRNTASRNALFLTDLEQQQSQDEESYHRFCCKEVKRQVAFPLTSGYMVFKRQTKKEAKFEERSKSNFKTNRQKIAKQEVRWALEMESPS